LLTDPHLRLHNTPGVFTRFPFQRGTTPTGREYTPAVLDLALSRGPVGSAVTTWGIDDSFQVDSDHQGITLHLSFEGAAGAAQPVYFRDWRTANWTAFDERVSRLDLNNLSVTWVTTTMLEAIEAAAPKPGRKFAPWWTLELDRLQTRVKAARRRARGFHSELKITKRSECPVWATYDSLQKQWKEAVAQARSQYIAFTLASADHQSVWRVLKRHQAHRCALPMIDGADEFEGKCAAFRAALFPPAAAATPEPLRDEFVRGTADLRGERRPVTRAEIDRVLARLNYGSALSPDKISYEVVKRLHHCLPVVLPRLFTALFDDGTHPVEWKTAHCVVIPKPGKGSYTAASSYRPISLLSCFGKVFEAIAAKRLADAAVRCGAMADSQMGAHAHHSAIDALLRVLDPFAHTLSQV
jgi:hypothetical protein